MKRTINDQIKNRIESHPEIKKGLKKVSHYSPEMYFNDARRWAKAIKEGRIICDIPHVSSSGMSRNIKFLECTKYDHKNEFMYLNFFAFFKANNHTEASQKDGSFRIGGCGMDMVFHTNYSLIHRLGKLGILNKKEVNSLSQKTPHVV